MPLENLQNETLLIREMQAGSHEAFTILYRHYSPLLYINIQSMLHDPAATEELVQELFTRIWQKRAYKGISDNFTGYMYRIAQHLVHDFFRKLKKDHMMMEKFKALTTETEAAKAEGLLQQQQSYGLIEKAIDHLPPQQKKAYKLVKQEGCTYKKAAEDMGISPFTVKEYLNLANKSIRNYLLTKVDSPHELIMSALIFFLMM